MTNEKLLNAYRFHRTSGHWQGRKRPITSATIALQRARDDVATGKARYPKTDFGAVCWQPVDADSPSYAKRAERLAFVQDIDGAGLRLVGKVEAESHGGRRCWTERDSCGWYSDNDQIETIYGVVYQLPGRDGKARFVAGYASADDCDGLPTIEFGAIYSEDMRGDFYNESAQELEAARDAARAADSMAQHAAESEREYKAASSAGMRFAELAEEIASERKEALALLAERRRAAIAGQGETFTAICATIRQSVKASLRTIRKARAERVKLMEGDFISEWLPGWNTRDSRLVDAFNESAGIRA